MTDKKIGLFLGKFAPFHRGHQLVVETALREVEKLILVIYDCPETTKIPLTVRANWVRKLYPCVEVIEGWGGSTETGYTKEIKRKQEDYILNLLDGRKITSFYSSEPYGGHMGIALNAENRQIDLARKKIPISGTEIRRNPFRYRRYLDPIVYRDFVANIVFLGAPSTGKTTIAKELAKKYNTCWMPEYGREYWGQHQASSKP